MGGGHYRSLVALRRAQATIEIGQANAAYSLCSTRCPAYPDARSWVASVGGNGCGASIEVEGLTAAGTGVFGRVTEVAAGGAN
jgi:hypothetical protein